MSVLASDSFTRANENPLAGNWATVPGWTALRLVSNAVTAAADNTDSMAYYDAVAPPNDQYSQVKVTTFGVGDGGAACRISLAAISAYYSTAWSGSLKLYKIVGGSVTELGASGTAYVNTDVIRIEAQGTTVRMFQNGVQTISVTDTALASGEFGLYMYDDTVRFDEWEGGDFVGGTLPRKAHQYRLRRSA